MMACAFAQERKVEANAVVDNDAGYSAQLRHDSLKDFCLGVRLVNEVLVEPPPVTCLYGNSDDRELVAAGPEPSGLNVEVRDGTIWKW